MNAWKDANYPTMDMREYRFYQYVFRDRTVEYDGSEVLCLGSCDISGNREVEYWHEIYSKMRNVKYTKIGQPGQSFSALMRQFYAYLKNAPAPKLLLLVVPITSPEHVLDNKCYSVTYRPLAVEHYIRTNMIPENVLDTFTALHNAYAASNNLNEKIYNFCREFSFLEMMCKAHNIELKWTFNITRSADEHYKERDKFLDAHDFAKSTYLQTSECMTYDKTYLCPTSEAHFILASTFMKELNDSQL